MARIAREELEQLKREVSIKALAEQKGIELKQQGKDWAGLCPFHEETSASLIISPHKNLFHCFGCGAAGSAVDWVMKSENVSFRHAVEILRELEGRGAAPLPENGRPLAKLAPALERSVSDEKLLLQVLELQAQVLWHGSEAGLVELAQHSLGACSWNSKDDWFNSGQGEQLLDGPCPRRPAPKQAQEQRAGRLLELGDDHQSQPVSSTGRQIHSAVPLTRNEREI